MPPLTASQRHPLAAIMHHEATPRARVRAPGMLRRAQGMQSKAIATLEQVASDPVATWLTQGAQTGVASLSEKPRRGRPPKLPLEAPALARP